MVPLYPSADPICCFCPDLFPAGLALHTDFPCCSDRGSGIRRTDGNLKRAIGYSGAGLPESQDLASEAITELEAMVDDLRDIVALGEKEEGEEK